MKFDADTPVGSLFYEEYYQPGMLVLLSIKKAENIASNVSIMRAKFLALTSIETRWFYSGVDYGYKRL